MQYAVIAAGEGSRLAQEGITAPKPLVEVGGEVLLDRLLRIFVDNGASCVNVIVNDQHPSTLQHLHQLQQKGWPLRYVVKSTPSSMHSFYELSPLLREDEPFVLTTVDTVFREQEFHRYVAALERTLAEGAADGLMGVTDYIDDEKPLYVATDDNLNIQAFLDENSSSPYVSGGIYGLHPRSLQTLRACVERGEHRMRNFQRALLRDGLRLKAWPFGKVFDIDHAADIAKAVSFLNEDESASSST